MNTNVGVLGLALVSFGASAECLNESSLRSLDAQFEEALATGQLGYFDEALHADFVWVHNHAGMVQRSRQEVLAFLEEVSAGNGGSTQDRVQRDVEVTISEAAGVVYGFTDVTRGGQSLTFHFMRAYSLVNGECLLIANHTMAIPQE